MKAIVLMTTQSRTKVVWLTSFQGGGLVDFSAGNLVERRHQFIECVKAMLSSIAQTKQQKCYATISTGHIMSLPVCLSVCPSVCPYMLNNKKHTRVRQFPAVELKSQDKG